MRASTLALIGILAITVLFGFGYLVPALVVVPMSWTTYLAFVIVLAIVGVAKRR